MTAYIPTKEPVTFESGGTTLRGNLYLPVRSGLSRAPGIVVAGSWTTVKEQMAGVYARRLAERGFVTLAFDFRHWGESGGEPRQFESPAHKIEDIVNAARFLARRSEVTPEQIGGLAICAGAGYVAHAIRSGAPIRSLAFVAAWLHDPATVGSVYGGAGAIVRRLAAADEAERRFASTRQMTYVPAYDPDDPTAAMFFPLDYYARPGRGAVPAWTNRFAVTSWRGWLTFDALAPASSITTPTLMVHSDEAALPENARRFFTALPGPKDLLWTSGTQTDFYDREPQVSVAIDAVVAHFSRTLGEPVPEATATDRYAIADAVTMLLYGVDHCDWDAVRSVLADEVRTDHTSLGAPAPQTQSAADVIDGWRPLFHGFDATQHLTGPILADVSGHSAHATCAVTAVHRLGSEHWTVNGHYDLRLTRAGGRWVVSAITYNNVLVSGDSSLPERARSRGEAHQKSVVNGRPACPAYQRSSAVGP